MSQDAAQQMTGRFIDADTLQPMNEAGGVPVVFFMEAVQDADASAAAGRPIYVEREYIKKFTPGDPYSVAVRPVREEDRKEYAASYQRFKAEQREVVSGTPLEVWPIMTRAQVKELAHFGLRTVEQLAALPDDKVKAVAPLADLRRSARDWLALANGGTPTQQARGEVDALRKELAALKRQVATSAKGKKPAKPRRTPKSTGAKPVRVKGA